MALDYQKEGKIAIFTINRPEARNAMNLEVNRELSEAMADFRDDDDLWVGIVTGAGDKAFSAGADINELLPFLKKTADTPWRIMPNPSRGFELYKPLIAAVNGMALGGGCELALACDLRIAVENARFGQPEILLGLVPGAGGTQRLSRMIPSCKAAEMLLMGKPITAQEAYRIGLINKVVPREELMSTAMEWAETICKAGPLAVRASKEAMLKGSAMTLADGLRFENLLFTRIMDTEDFAEGVAAFNEKRKANFKGK
ncbi:MAG: enoyl-CoA hydratase-related protein [Dehalococcoidales bacterium]|nr:enoyl-CoA hydratase-related protein [Dehalococcoidales bacterium]